MNNLSRTCLVAACVAALGVSPCAWGLPAARTANPASGKLATPAQIGTLLATSLTTDVPSVPFSPAVVISTAIDNQAGTVTCTVYGGVTPEAWNVSFSVYNYEDGADMTFWYQATEQPDGTWIAVIPASAPGVGYNHVEVHMNIGETTVSPAATDYLYEISPRIVDDIAISGGDYDVSFGMSGLKVLRIHEALGIGRPDYPNYLEDTVACVQQFQSAAGLPATGVVDYNTWIALGLDENEWYTLASYASPVAVPLDATADMRIDAMITCMWQYLENPYIWNASGAPGQGIDCVGLMLQGLYAGGLHMGIIDPVTHASTEWGNRDAYNMFHFGGLAPVDPQDIQMGDLMFFESHGRVNHVGAYIGDNLVLESYPGGVRVGFADAFPLAGVRRPFV